MQPIASSQWCLRSRQPRCSSEIQPTTAKWSIEMQSTARSQWNVGVESQLKRSKCCADLQSASSPCCSEICSTSSTWRLVTLSTSARPIRSHLPITQFHLGCTCLASVLVDVRVKTKSRIGHDVTDTAETCTIAQHVAAARARSSIFRCNLPRGHTGPSLALIFLQGGGGGGLRHPHKLASLPLEVARSRIATYATSV